MNRNVESHFADLPSVEIQRSIFDRSSTHKTSFNVGDLIPIYIDEVLPGDSFKMTTSKVVRSQTMLTPIMDNMYLDTYFFFVPLRLCWTHAKEFFGENSASAWWPSTTYSIPKIAAPSSTGFSTGGIADYMGLPVNTTWSATDPGAPSALPFRGYALICDQWFRDENVTDPLNIPTGDSNQTGTNGSSYINDVANGGAPFKVARYHDYFSSALPGPMKKATPVAVTSSGISGKLPVVTMSANHEVGGISTYWSYGSGGTIPSGTVYRNFINDTSSPFNANFGNATSYPTSPNTSQSNKLEPVNLWARAIGAGNDFKVSFTVNDLRLAFQLQKFYEKQARGGSRYIEVIKQHFGVTSPDARLQRTEYLGGNRVPVAVHEVTNSAQSTQDFLGDLGAKSHTIDVHQDFERSFTEHGYIIGVCCIRYDHSYPQGLERFWSRSKFSDFYWPVFANLGEQPVYTRELYGSSSNIANDYVFGYQEAWADYRYKPDRVSGEMRPGISNTLASWHLSDYYTAQPTLSDSWMREDKSIVDRVLAVQSSVSNQFFADFYFKCICTRPMPMYSIPGLIDHH